MAFLRLRFWWKNWYREGYVQIGAKVKRAITFRTYTWTELRAKDGRRWRQSGAFYLRHTGITCTIFPHFQQRRSIIRLVRAYSREVESEGEQIGRGLRLIKRATQIKLLQNLDSEKSTVSRFNTAWRWTRNATQTQEGWYMIWLPRREHGWVLQMFDWTHALITCDNQQGHQERHKIGFLKSSQHMNR